MREHLLDRIAITLSADVPFDFKDRVTAVEAAIRFQVWRLISLHHPILDAACNLRGCTSHVSMHGLP